MAAGSISLGKSDKRVTSAPGTPPVTVKRPTLRVVAEDAKQGGPKLRFLIAHAGGEEIDVTRAMTAPLAYVIWQLRGGADIGNWVDAEELLCQLLTPHQGATSAGLASAAPSPVAEVVIPGKRTTTLRR